MIGCRADHVASETASSPLTVEELRLADSLLTVGLDNEALYTLLDTLKPISSVAGFYVGVTTPDSGVSKEVRSVRLQAGDAEKLGRLQRIVNSLRLGPVRLLLVPFRDVNDGRRYVEVYAVRDAAVRAVLRNDSAFWLQRGFTAGSDIASLITAVEFDRRYDRWRGYGYLFGYPKNAVDFFVQSGQSFDSTKVFVPRDFFQIPAYSGEQRRFVYAVPKGYVPSERDSLLRTRATETLKRYKTLRSSYMNADSTLRAAELIVDHQFMGSNR